MNKNNVIVGHVNSRKTLRNLWENFIAGRNDRVAKQLRFHHSQIWKTSVQTTNLTLASQVKIKGFPSKDALDLELGY
ncbi:hypothetical protein C7B76_14115 [filamentous cyanobacterium CCP2]|nr:hypothetical protein C7B76_14115 [filamentous cyanobacterium CCP2]